MQRCVFIVYSSAVIKVIFYEGLDIVEVGLSGIVGVPDFRTELGDLLQMLALLVDEQFVEGEIEIMHVLDE